VRVAGQLIVFEYIVYYERCMCLMIVAVYSAQSFQMIVVSS
jgi:hypothetical protein